jgi:hypothetical protein
VSWKNTSSRPGWCNPSRSIRTQARAAAAVMSRTSRTAWVPAATDGDPHGLARALGSDLERAERGREPAGIGAGGSDQVKLELPGPRLELGRRAGGRDLPGVDEHDRPS